MSNDKYIHSEVENKIYAYWEKNNLFDTLLGRLIINISYIKGPVFV